MVVTHINKPFPWTIKIDMCIIKPLYFKIETAY